MIDLTDSIDIDASISVALAAKKKQFPCHVNRISGLDDPCLRRLYYSRHDWDKAAPIDDGLQGTFETGNILEQPIERIIAEVGAAGSPRWRMIGSQTPANDGLFRKYQISGTLDGFLQVEFGGKWTTLGVVDIKTMSPNIFRVVNTIDDLERFEWTKKYRGQVELYALAHNLDTGYLLLVNKQNLYSIKLIKIPVDLDHCESLLQKADAVNQAIETETPPERINDPAICNRCKFESFCCPETEPSDGVTFSNDDDLAATLDRLEELVPTKKEITALEKDRDSRLVKGCDVVCGRFLITWKEITVRRKAVEASEMMQWRKKIVAT